MLKAMLGAIAAGDLVCPDDRTPVRDVLAGSGDALLETLFRGQDWPNGWRLHVGDSGLPAPRTPERSVRGAVVTDETGAAIEFRQRFGVVALRICLGAEAGTRRRVHRPSAILLNHAHGEAQRLLALAWPDGDHRMIVPYTKGGIMKNTALSLPKSWSA